MGVVEAVLARMETALLPSSELLYSVVEIIVEIITTAEMIVIIQTKYLVREFFLTCCYYLARDMRRVFPK